MAIIFQLWVEADHEEGLQSLKEYFHNLEHTLLTGKAIRFRADIENGDMRGLCVWSPQICGNGRGIETLQDALEATEVGIFLYHHLGNVPAFRFAEVGWDAENRTSFELSDRVKTLKDGRKLWEGFDCVINDELFKELGSPLTFHKFREGYWWQKYIGETYYPLSSNDQNELLQLCEQLLPINCDD